MHVFSTSPPNVIQPIFRLNSWHRKPLELMDNVSRWRAIATDMNLSAEALLRLEWMIFYETVGQKDAYKTAGHFAVTPKTFYKWHKHRAWGRYTFTLMISDKGLFTGFTLAK